MRRRELHPRYMGSFVDFYVENRQSTGDMKLIYFVFISSPTVLCCFVFAILWSDCTYLEVAGRDGDQRLC